MVRCVSAVLEVGSGLAGPWALGCLLLVAHATVHVSGPSAALGVLLAAAAALIAALYASAPRQHSTRDGELLSFLSLWAQLLGHGAALAACARTLSATMDYVSGGRYGSWLARQVGLPVRGSLPDLLAVVVTLVPSVLIALGLEQSGLLRLVLNMAVGGSILFLVSVGTAHTDRDNWGHQDLLVISSSKVLTGAAMCSYGFIGFACVAARTRTDFRKVQVVTMTVTAGITVLSYCAVAVVLVVMVHFSALEDSDVPLVKVFEVRDVDWARLVMAVFMILCLGLTLLEVSSPLHSLVVSLAGEDWQVLPRMLSRESSLLGTPVLAIMSCGCMLGLLAGVCPMYPLLQVMCSGPLIDQAIRTAEAIHRTYHPPPDGKTVRYRRLGGASCEGEDTDDEDPEAEVRRRARRRQQKVTASCLKARLALLPSAIKHRLSDAPRLYSGVSRPVCRSSVTSHDSDNTLLTSMSCEDVFTRSASVDSFVDHAGLLWATVDGEARPSPKLTDNPLANTVPATLSSNKPHITNNISNINYISFNKHGLNGVKKDLLQMCEQESECVFNASDENNGIYKAKFYKAASTSDDGNLLREHIKNPAEASRVYESLGCSQEEVSDGADDPTSSSSSTVDGNSHSSTTDIDAAVAEYKERLKVVATRPEAQPTRTTSRVVAALLCALVSCAGLLGAATLTSGEAGVWCAVSGAAGMMVVLVVIAWQPRAHHDGQQQLVPWLPTAGLVLNTVLCSHLVVTVWPAVLAWMLAGSALYWWRRGRRSMLKWTSCRRRRRYSSREQIRLEVPPRQSTVPRLIPSHQRLPGDRARRITCVDTILIAR